tara:strand:+ start:2563 stop:3261 length:699 start_codon:yes stop_codon:yes gene_type:complete
MKKKNNAVNIYLFVGVALVLGLFIGSIIGSSVTGMAVGNRGFLGIFGGGGNDEVEVNQAEVAIDESMGSILGCDEEGATGTFSFVAGRNTAACGAYSTAMGASSVASNTGAFAIGHSSVASGTYSTTMGSDTKASGSASTAMGHGSIASGKYSTAIGSNGVASHQQSVVIDASSYTLDCETTEDYQFMTCADSFVLEGLPTTEPDNSGTQGMVCITNDGELWIDADGTFDCA